MAESEKKGFTRRFLIPRRPKIRHRGMSVREELQALKKGLGDKSLICPNDGSKLKLIDVFDAESDQSRLLPVGADTPVTRALGCDCGYHLPVEPIIERARTHLAQIKSAERQFILVGAAVVVIFGVISYWNGTLVTLLGGLVFGLFLILRGVAFRYRYWLVSEGRLFETGIDPLREWLGQEWRS